MTKLLCNKAVSGLRKRINAAIIDEDEEIEEIDENEGSDEDNEIDANPAGLKLVSLG
jgi:hypothetical protein